MIDLGEMGDEELDDLSKKIQAEKVRRRKLTEEKFASKFEDYIGKIYFDHGTVTDRYLKVLDSSEGYLTGHEIRHLKDAEHGWSVDTFGADSNDFKHWKEISVLDWEVAKRSLIEDATEDWSKL